MIYPLPNKLSSKQVPQAPMYLYIPEYKGTVIRKVEAGQSHVTTAQQRRSQNILDNVAPALIANALRTEGTFGVIDLIIENENNEATKVGIWPQHLLSSNFGNEAGITITSANSNQTFAGILSAINNSRLTVNMLHVEGEVVERGDFNINIIKTDDNSLLQTNRLNFFLSPFQFQVNIMQLQHTFILDFSTSLEFTLPGNSTLFLKLFQSARSEPNLSQVDFTNQVIGTGFSPIDNITGFPSDSFDSGSSPNRDSDVDSFLSGLITDEPERRQRLADRLALRQARKSAKAATKEQRHNAKLAARATRGYVVRSTDMLPGTNRVNARMEQEFFKKAHSEFNQEELSAIYSLRDNNYLKFEEMVLNYNFDSMFSNLRDFLE